MGRRSLEENSIASVRGENRAPNGHEKRAEEKQAKEPGDGPSGGAAADEEPATERSTSSPRAISGVKRAARAIACRSQGFQRGRPTVFRSATISCCRSSAFSPTRDNRDRRRSVTRSRANRRKSIMALPRTPIGSGWHL